MALQTAVPLLPCPGQACDTNAGSPLSVGDQAIAGAGAGCAGALIACPTELIKCRLQAQANSQPKQAAAHSKGLATLNQPGQGLATLVQAGGPQQAVFRQPQAGAAIMQGFAGQPLGAARQQAGAGLAGLSRSGKGLAGLVQAGASPQGFSTLHMGAAAPVSTKARILSRDGRLHRLR